MNKPVPPESAPAQSDAPDKPAVDLTRADLKGAAGSVPHMPNDRDETVGATGGIPSETVKQGARDLKRGLQDTSRAPEADRAYKKQT